MATLYCLSIHFYTIFVFIALTVYNSTEMPLKTTIMYRSPANKITAGIDYKIWNTLL